MSQGPEYAFVCAARFVGDRKAASSPSIIAAARTLAPTFALNALGYDARAYSLFSGGALPAELGNAKALVLADLGAGDAAGYRNLLASVPGRVFYDLVEPPEAGSAGFGFCLEAARAGAVFTAASEHVAQAVSALLGRAVQTVAEPFQGARREPHAPRAKLRSRALDWLAQRAGVETESWRLRLLWSGEESEIASIVQSYPALVRLGRDIPLALHCIAPQGAALEALADQLHEDEPDALRLTLQAWSPATMAQSLAACDLVLLPGAGAALRSRMIGALQGGRLGIARAAPYYGKLAGFAWTGEELAEGIRWALFHPSEALERLRGGQRYLDEVHEPAGVARAWMALFLKDKK